MGLNPYIPSLDPTRFKPNPVQNKPKRAPVLLSSFLFSAHPIILLHPPFLHSFILAPFLRYFFYRIHRLSCIFFITLYFTTSHIGLVPFFCIFILSILNLLKCEYRLNINHAYLSHLSFILFSRRS